MPDYQVPRVGVIIPTRDAGRAFPDLLAAICRQDLPLVARLVVDSGSQDGTAERAREAGFEVFSIAPQAFGHGRTRRNALARLLRGCPLDIVIYLTQDVVLEDATAFRRLVLPLWLDDGAGAAYGRPLPHHGASPGAAVLRATNYPPKSCRKTLADREALGLRAPFLSDSFAAYRVIALRSVGSFPDVEICEDMMVGARMLTIGWAVRYEAGACVRHSHELTLREAWRRYHAIGRFHRAEPWLRDAFGRAEGAGLGLLRMQMHTAWDHRSPLLALRFLAEDAVKYLAYRVH